RSSARNARFVKSASSNHFPSAHQRHGSDRRGIIPESPFHPKEIRVQTLRKPIKSYHRFVGSRHPQRDCSSSPTMSLSATSRNGQFCGTDPATHDEKSATIANCGV